MTYYTRRLFPQRAGPQLQDLGARGEEARLLGLPLDGLVPQRVRELADLAAQRLLLLALPLHAGVQLLRVQGCRAVGAEGAGLERARGAELRGGGAAG